VASDCAQWTRAARWFGAAEAHAAETGSQRDSADQAFLAPRIDIARAKLEREFDAAEGEGRNVALRNALVEVQAWLASGAPAASDGAVR
jgi:hypothetical protein